MSLEPAFAPLPQGRLLYWPSSATSYVLVRRHATGELYITHRGWRRGSESAGPFLEREALRAVRLANTAVPEGCQLHTWSRGITLFDRGPLPGAAADWALYDLSLLPPSITAYTAEDANGVVEDRCCAPPRDPPKVEWAEALRDGVAKLLAERGVRHVWGDLPPNPPSEPLPGEHVGRLREPWNVHPKGSWVVAEGASFERSFLVIDLPPAPEGAIAPAS